MCLSEPLKTRIYIHQTIAFLAIFSLFSHPCPTILPSFQVLIDPACFKIEGLVFSKLISVVSKFPYSRSFILSLVKQEEWGYWGLGLWLVCYLVSYQTGCSFSYRKRNRQHDIQ